MSQQGENERTPSMRAWAVWIGVMALVAMALVSSGILLFLLSSVTAGGPLTNLGGVWGRTPAVGAFILTFAALMVVGLWVASMRLLYSGRRNESAEGDTTNAQGGAARSDTEMLSRARLLSDRPPSEDENPTEADRLRFGEFVSVLASVIRESASNSPFTISIEAEWGNGKTTAMRMLRHELNNSPAHDSWTYRTVWFDAWTYRRTEIQKGFLSTIFQAFQDDVRASSLDPIEKKQLITMALNLAGRAAQVGDVGTLLAQGLDTELRYRNQFKYDFGKILTRWAELRHAKRMLLTVFIDELDRCQPDETAQVLEMMKLFFDTQGCIFVLAYDVELVAECVRQAYKPVITDGMSYLKKLIQVSYPLPTPSNVALYAYIQASVADARLTTFFNEVSQQITAQSKGAKREGALSQGALPATTPDYVPLIIRGTRRSPREIKRFLNALVVSTRVVAARLEAARLETARNSQIFMTLCILLLLQIRWPHFHKALVFGSKTEKDLADIYGYLDAVPRAGATSEAHEETGGAAGSAARGAQTSYIRTESDPAFPAQVNPFALTPLRDRFPWLFSDEELHGFLRDYPLRGQAQQIRQLVSIGLPVVEDVAVEAAKQEESFQADAKSLFELSHLPPPEHFIGRAADLAWLTNQLRPGGEVKIASIQGMGGIGKTALAATAARLLYAQGHFAGGIAVVSCRGETNALEVLHTVLSRFGSEQPLPNADDEGGLVNAAHRLLDGKDALIVLDDVEPGLEVERIVEPLRETGVTLLLTSRQALPLDAVPSEAMRTLGLLSSTEAMALFAQAYGRNSVNELTQSERAAASRIVKALEFHTLAIKLAGAYAADVKRDLATLAAELAEPHRAIELSQNENPRALALIFEESTSQLPAQVKRLFMAFAAFTALDFSRNAALALARELHLPENGVDLLVHRALVDAEVYETLPANADRERLRLHPLVRAFAEDLAAHQLDNTLDDGRRIICDYYARYVDGADSDGLDANTLEVDEDNIEGALIWAHERGLRRQVVDLCVGMRGFWYARSNIQAGTDMLQWGIDDGTAIAAQTSARADRLHVADLRLTAAQFLRYQGHLEEAETVLRENLEERLELVDRRGEGAVLSQLGQIARIRGRLNDAESDFGQSISLRQEVGDRAGQAYDLSQLGHIFKTRGYLGEAEERFQNSLSIFREIGDRRREGATLGYIGRVYQARGMPKEADKYFNQSLKMATEERDARGEATVLSSLGQLELARGQFARAEEYLQKALAIHRSIRDRQGEAGDLSQCGRLALDREDLDTARTYFEQSLEINREVQNVPDEGVDLSQLGLVAIEKHQLEEAKVFLEQSLTIRRQVPDPRGEGVDMALLGRIAFEEGRLDDAQQYFTESLARARGVRNQRGAGVNLRYLAAIAERSEESDRTEALYQAEAHYREALQIAQDVQNGLDIAAAQLGLGRLLIEERQNRDEGCMLIQQAVAQYGEWQLSRVETARALAARLGCSVSP